MIVSVVSRLGRGGLWGVLWLTLAQGHDHPRPLRQLDSLDFSICTNIIQSASCIIGNYFELSYFFWQC
jgi:hypothetical protein